MTLAIQPMHGWKRQLEITTLTIKRYMIGNSKPKPGTRDPKQEAWLELAPSLNLYASHIVVHIVHIILLSYIAYPID